MHAKPKLLGCVTISGTEKTKTTWNTWLEKGLWGGSLEGRHQRSCDYSGRWLLILWVIFPLCWLEKIHLQEVNDFNSNVFRSFIFPQEIHYFRGNVYTLFKSIKKIFGWNVLVSFFSLKHFFDIQLFKENSCNRVLFLILHNTRFPVSLRQLSPLFYWFKHWNLSEVDLAFATSGGGTITFSKMFFEGCSTAFPLTSRLHTEGRNKKGSLKYILFLCGLKNLWLLTVMQWWHG